MHVNQQQSSNGTINRVVQLLQSGTFKQKNLSDKISHEEINRLVNDIISSSEDNKVKLHRSKRGIGDDIYKIATYIYRWYQLSKKLGWDRGSQVVTRHLGTQSGQQKALDTARGTLGEVETLGDFIDTIKRFLYPTEAPQVTEVPQVTERQQVTTEAQQVTEVSQATEGRQVTERSRITEVPQVTRRQQVTEVSQTTEGLQVTEGQRVTERQQVIRGQQVTTEAQQVTERQHTTERQQVTTEKYHRLQRDCRLRRIIAIHLYI